MVCKPRQALVGAGHMGSALLAGWLNNDLAVRGGALIIADPAPTQKTKDLATALQASLVPALEREKCSLLETVVLALKPDLIGRAAPQIRDALPARATVVSVAAGVPLARLAALYGDRPLVRAMPNTPAAIGRGATVYATNGALDKATEENVHALLAATGFAEKTADERHLDAVTAVSGSGPAYVFLLAETMMAAGIAEGLTPELARKLACETVAGAGELLRQGGNDPAALRHAVTSPGGTTAAALDVLMGAGGFAEMMRRAVNAAARRSSQLGAGQIRPPAED